MITWNLVGRFIGSKGLCKIVWAIEDKDGYGRCNHKDYLLAKKIF